MTLDVTIGVLTRCIVPAARGGTGTEKRESQA